MPETWPDIAYPSRVRFYLEPYTQVFESELTRSVQTKEIPGQRFLAELYWTVMHINDFLVYRGFLARLAGMAGRVNLWDMAHETPRGVGTGTPKVKVEAAAGSKTLVTKGWTPSQSGILLMGDRFKVNGELKEMTYNADSDGAGDATLTFAAPLRAAAPVDAVITVDKPTCKMMLISDNQAAVDLEHPYLAKNITCSFMEDFS